MRQAAITILGGVLALLGLGYACVQRELPRLEGNLPGLIEASVAGSHVPAPEMALPDPAPIEREAAAEGLAAECQRQLDGLLADEMIHFEVLSAAIRPSSRGLLDELAQALAQCPDAVIEIAGHTDSEGIADLNLKLSEARAESVRNFLIHMGIDSDRLVAVGYGSTQPIADDGREEGRQQNRRIEFKVQGIKA